MGKVHYRFKNNESPELSNEIETKINNTLNNEMLITDWDVYYEYQGSIHLSEHTGDYPVEHYLDRR